MFDSIDWLQWRNQAVRDLVWVMASPSLLHHEPCDEHACEQRVTDAWCHSLMQQNLTWLHRLDNEPRPLLTWLREHQTEYLGRYFESLLAFWLHHVAETELLAQNLVIRQGVRQIGEFDFIFRDCESDQFRHWEVAVKFYLHLPGHEQLWLGPNPRDSLQSKLNKVFNQQLQLAQHPQAQMPLLERCGTADVAAATLVKGYLFYPHDSNWQSLYVPEPQVASTHLRGWWCYQSQLADVLNASDTAWRWMIVPRMRWLAPVLSHSDVGLLDADTLLREVADYFESNRHALLLVALQAQGSDWLEVSRGFVVEDTWPQAEE